MGKIKVIVKRPDERVGHIEEIENKLESFQDIVEGYIEEVFLSSSLVFICNEEGKIRGMRYNFSTDSDDIMGPVIICGIKGEDFSDVSISLESWEQQLKDWGN